MIIIIITIAFLVNYFKTYKNIILHSYCNGHEYVYSIMIIHTNSHSAKEAEVEKERGDRNR